LIPRTGSHIWKCIDSVHLPRLVAFCAVVLAVACSGLPSHPEIDEKAEEFSARRARAHYAALLELGPRTAGTDAAARARVYVERELRWAGARVVEAAPSDGLAKKPVLAWLPGASEDRILVAAPWAPARDGTGLDDAGVALLLELTRVLARQKPPYTVGIALAVVAPGAGVGPVDRQAIQRAGQELVEVVETEVAVEALRAVLVVEPRAGPARVIARDLRSNPVIRNLFWRTAARLGHGDRFREDGEWATPGGIQEAFLDAGYGRVVSLVDEGAADPSEAQEEAAGRRGLPDPADFEPVGEVAYEGLLRLMGRFTRVDAFSG